VASQRLRIWTYVYVHACPSACLSFCKYTCIHSCMYACIHVCMYACWTHTCIWKNLCKSVRLYTYRYVFMHIGIWACMQSTNLKAHCNTLHYTATHYNILQPTNLRATQSTRGRLAKGWRRCKFNKLLAIAPVYTNICIRIWKYIYACIYIYQRGPLVKRDDNAADLEKYRRSEKYWPQLLYLCKYIHIYIYIYIPKCMNTYISERAVGKGMTTLRTQKE